MLKTVRKPAKVLLGIVLLIEGMLLAGNGAFIPYYVAVSWSDGAKIAMIGFCVMFSGCILLGKSPRWKFLPLFTLTILLMMWRGGILLSPYEWKFLFLLPFAGWFGG